MNTSLQLVRRLALALTLVLSVGAVGCIGSMEPLGDDDNAGDDDDQPPAQPDAAPPTGGNPDAAPPVGGGDPETLFTTNVVPKMNTCAACHVVSSAIGFLGSNSDTSTWYDAIIASADFTAGNPTISKIYTHTHLSTSYPEFDADTKTKVLEWLNAEAAQ
jgi:hypothetical protein